jgi:hypothetical protein
MVEDRDRNAVVGSGPDRSGAAAVEEEYWTPERRAAARPISRPAPSREELTSQPERVTAPSPEAGQSGHLPSSAPPDEQNPGNVGTAERESELPDLSAGGNPVPRPLTYPYTTCGKLYFTQGGGDFTASASVVAPNILLTAGHCVFDGGAWSQNVTFFPSYPSRSSSDSPAGTSGMSRTARQWHVGTPGRRGRPETRPAPPRGRGNDTTPTRRQGHESGRIQSRGPAGQGVFMPR